MKTRLLSIGTAVLLLTLPQAGFAASITSSFLTSSTGTSTIGLGDTIQFEVSFQSSNGILYNVMLATISGDTAAALSSSAVGGWAGVSNDVSDWQWKYSPPGSGTVDFSVASPQSPADYTAIIANDPFPTPVVVGIGWFSPPTGSSTGTGTPSVIGTVTITADTLGSFQGGAFRYPGVDGFFYDGAIEDPVTVVTASYVVTPEPGVATLVALGLAGLAGIRKLGVRA